MRHNGDEGLNLFYGRLNDCVYDIRDNIPIDLYEEMKLLKTELVMWAISESEKNITQAAKILNINRTTLISMMENELADYLVKKKAAK